MSVELKPCPFCGGGAQVQCNGERIRGHYVACLFCGTTGKKFYRTIEGEPDSITREQAVDWWNRRAASAAPAEGRQALCDRIVCEQNGACVNDDVAHGRKCEARQAVGERSEFKREHGRYFVIKRKDLNSEQLRALIVLLDTHEIPTRQCVVVEEDWPEYEPVWAMIEARMTGRAALATAPTPCKGKNCGATDGVNHSQECRAEHDAIVAAADDSWMLRGEDRCDDCKLNRSARCPHLPIPVIATAPTMSEAVRALLAKVPVKPHAITFDKGWELLDELQRIAEMARANAEGEKS